MILKIADFFISILSGALVAGIVFYISPQFMPMIIGGLVGMFLTLLLKILLMPFFGAFEVMIPLGIIGMTVGMGAGMLSTLANSGIVIAYGALIGLIIATIIHLSNKRLTAE